MSSGLNFLFVDIEDDYKNTGSFVGAHFFTPDQSPSSGFNSMNLIYVDISPGTLGWQMDDNISKKTTYREIIRNIGRLLLYQISPQEEDLWIQEGFSQFLIYRLLGSSKTFPYTPTRILGAPTAAVPEADIWLSDLAVVKPGYPFLSEYHHTEQTEIKNTATQNMDRVFIRQNPRLPADNRRSPYFRGFSYLFFTYLFHRTGGSFQKRLTDGDRFFQEVLRESSTGFVGLEKALTKRSAPDFRTLYTEFALSLFLNVTEERFKKQVYEFRYPELQQFTQTTSITQPDQFVMEPWALDIRKFTNPDSVLWEGRINILPRFDYSRIFIMSRDIKNNFFIEEELGTHKDYFFVPPGEDKYILFLNLDSVKKTHRVEVFQKNYNQQVLIPNSSGNFGTVTTEILIDSSTVPSTGQTGSVSITLMQSGIYNFYVSNESTAPLLWSVEKKEATTNLFFESSRKTSLSVMKSSQNLGTDRSLLQREGSRENFIFIYPGTQRLDFSLFFTALNPEEFVDETTKTSPSTGGIINEQNLSEYAGGGMSGCFIATAAFGSKNHTVVRILSEFRDRFLLKHDWGRAFVSLYYRYSPAPADFIRGNSSLRFIFRLLLLPFFAGVIIFKFLTDYLWIGLFLACSAIFYLFRHSTLYSFRQKIIFSILLLLCFPPAKSLSAVSFTNNDPNPTRGGHASLELLEISRTIGEIARNSFDTLGFSLGVPYSNQNDNPPVLNVFLYDIKDGQSNVDKAYPGYFNPHDQLRTSGTSLTNEISNFGNIIYLDLNPYNPLLDNSTIAQTQLTKNTLFGDKFYFYQNFSALLLELLLFQQQNSGYNGENSYYYEYEWLVRGLGKFAAFRFARTLKLCDNPGSLSCDGPELFSTARVDGQGNQLTPMLPYATTRFLHFNHRQDGTKLYPLPGLFHADFSPGVPQGSSIDEKEYTETSFGIGYLFFLYLWEQLEGVGEGLGDKFIAKLIKKGSKDFYIDQILSPKKIYDPYPYSHDPIPENNSVTGIGPGAECSNETIDKVCQINHLLKSLTDENVDYVPKTFEEYYLNFVGAVILNKASGTAKPGLFELRNASLRAAKRKNADVSYNNSNLNFDTGNNPHSIDYTWIISEEELRKILGEQETTENPGDTQAQPTEPQTEEPTVPETPVTVTSADKIPLSTFSFATILMNNANPNSDLRFPYGDQLDLNDNGTEDRTTNSIMSQLFRQNNREACTDTDPYDPNACIFTDREAQKGKGYFVIPRSGAGATRSTGVAAFIGLDDSGVKFKETAANFSRLRISSPDEPGSESTESPYYNAPEQFFHNWREFLMQEINDESELNFSVSSTGIKTYNSFKPIHAIKDKIEWTNDPSAFRNYMHSFKTVDFEKSTNEIAYVERRTGILKEVIEFEYPRWRLFLWVDQRNLPDSDSSTVPMTSTTDDLPATPPSLEEQKESIPSSLEVTRMSFYNTQNEEINKVEQIIKISGLKDTDLTIKNWLDVPVTVQFFLTNGSKASTIFEIVNNTRQSENYVITRNSILKSTNTIDSSITLSGQSQDTVRIRSKIEGNIEKSLVISIRKNVSQSADAVVPQEQIGGGSGGCFIATAAYGIEHENITLLSAFRDQILLKNPLGKQFVKLYYAYSPALARKIDKHGLSGTVTRLLLQPLVTAVRLFSGTDYDEKPKTPPCK
jgi:hypothetical protein